MRGNGLISFVLLLIFSGCYYDKEELLYPGQCDPGDATVPGYWAANIEPLIQTRCNNCHTPGGQGPGEIRTHAQVQNLVNNGQFQQLVLQSRAMPQGGALSSCDLQKLQAWVTAGAPN